MHRSGFKSRICCRNNSSLQGRLGRYKEMCTGSQKSYTQIWGCDSFKGCDADRAAGHSGTFSHCRAYKYHCVHMADMDGSGKDAVVGELYGQGVV